MAEERAAWERIARYLLLGLTLVLMASMGGGFLLLPLLVPGHLWAACRSSHPAARLRWSILPAASLGMVSWAGVYLAIGESKPLIWLVPLAVCVATLVLVFRTATRRDLPATVEFA